MQTLFLGGVRYDPSAAPMTKESAASVTASLDLWRGLDTSPSPMQMSFRLMAFRNATRAGVSPTLLANWRWHLNLWQDSDRAEFARAMTAAHTSLLQLQPQLKTAQN